MARISTGSKSLAFLFVVASASAQDSQLHLFCSTFVDAPPTIDGQASDDVWSRATPAPMVIRPAQGEGQNLEVIVSAVNTEKKIFFLVSWPDETKDNTHKTWTWNEETRVYEQGSDREDVVALAFAHTGLFSGDMLSGQEEIWDVWHWKAARTNTSGYAMDKTHVYTREKPQGNAKSFKAKDGADIWIARPEDTGDSLEKKQPAPEAFTEHRVAQYSEIEPSGSAADVRAKGHWADGRWTVEFARNLDTGHADDTSFLQGVPIRMAVAVFDRAEQIDHRISEVWEVEVAP